MPERPSSKLSKAIVRPLTTRNWADLERLFGPRGACAGCWCMWWRLERAKWDKQKGEKNRRACQKIVATDVPTGVLAYLGEEPVGWCAVAPREHYARLARSRVLRPVDDQPVWSVTCFFVRKEHRRSGLTRQLLQAAVQYADKHGAKIIEGYPPRTTPRGDAGCVCVHGIRVSFSTVGI